MSNSEPIVVLYKSSMCRHCTTLSNIWETPPGKDEDSVTSAMRKIYPHIRFFVVTSKDNTGKFDENAIPKDLIRYGKWYPMILLIPGKLWDSAMLKLGPKNDVQLMEGVQIMNGSWDKEELRYANKYDIRKPSEFAKWLKEALDNEDFKKIQNGNKVVVPTISSDSSRPIITNMIKPGNLDTNYVQAGPRSDIQRAISNDICSMRIISRPK